MIESIAGLFHPQLSFVGMFNFGVFIAFSAAYLYQIFYVFVSLYKTPKRHVAKRNHRFAVLIAARNESAVIGDLIRSIKMQNYPQELIDIFVIADNCTDNTAAISEAAGATVFKRFNQTEKGKGYALDHGYQQIKQHYGDRGYEAFFVFDADNVLDENYFREMNATFDAGAKASTSYRNSKNFDSNWISAGYGVWFLRESRFLNQSRLILGTSCAISGTGFFISADILEREQGWHWHLLTEDIEFSANLISSGERISYCPTAIIYDEQPTTFQASWNQRMRWARGFYQVCLNYGPRLIKGMFSNKKGTRFACYDMLMTIAPGLLLTIFTVAINLGVLILHAMGVISGRTMFLASATSITFCFSNYLMFMFLFGLLTTITEWRNIHTTRKRKILYMFTFPFFMITYVPIALVALVKRTEWKPIAHNISVDVNEYSTSTRKAA